MISNGLLQTTSVTKTKYIQTYNKYKIKNIKFTEKKDEKAIK